MRASLAVTAAVLVAGLALPPAFGGGEGLQPAAPSGPAQETDSRSEVAEVCPCFSIQDLVVLGAYSWDHCEQTPYLAQIMRWLEADPVPDSGRLGYHVIAVLTNPRSGAGSCQYLLRADSERSEESTYRRWSNLSESEAARCYEIFSTWLADSGGCVLEDAESSSPD